MKLPHAVDDDLLQRVLEVRDYLERKASACPSLRDEINFAIAMRTCCIERALRDAGFGPAADFVRDNCDIEQMPSFRRVEAS